MKTNQTTAQKLIIMIAFCLIASMMGATSNDTSTCGCEHLDHTCVELKMWYLDADNDGLGDMLNAQVGCTQPFRYVSNCLDLDDTDSGIGPDEDMMMLREWFMDEDGDGFGNALQVQLSKTKPAGYVADSTDANDADATIWFDINDEFQIAQNKEQH